MCDILFYIRFKPEICILFRACVCVRVCAREFFSLLRSVYLVNYILLPCCLFLSLALSLFAFPSTKFRYWNAFRLIVFQHFFSLSLGVFLSHYWTNAWFNALHAECDFCSGNNEQPTIKCTYEPTNEKQKQKAKITRINIARILVYISAIFICLIRSSFSITSSVALTHVHTHTPSNIVSSFIFSLFSKFRLL